MESLKDEVFAKDSLLKIVPPSWADQHAAPDAASDTRLLVRSAGVKGPLAPERRLG